LEKVAWGCGGLHKPLYFAAVRHVWFAANRGADEGGPRQFLTGWKAIAGHLGVDKSTAQRWVKTRGLPIKPDDPMNRSLKI
jgi:hypothetical protein